MNKRVAIVGMECLYPGARNYLELWENSRTGRRAFRRMPEQRLNKNYFAEHKDGIYQNHAAVIKDYHFDRIRFKIPEESFVSADISHWLALDIADRAIRDARLKLDDNLIANTGVFVGNTLTGEMTRSNLLRLRWPYVYQNLKLEMAERPWPEKEKNDFLERLEQRYKSAFPSMKEDSLAGGLSNTIAGRICNYFNFNGGGYTVDGACSSSLLAVTTACKEIESGRLQMALAGGVDISLDPFELVGFSRAGALARQEMKVFSKKSAGFWPGEGCGFVVLMDADLAIENNLSIYAYINGYGISSDGKGGLTRPKVSMQEKAIRHAYPNDSLEILRYVETHGTGTKIGDLTELQALANVSASVNQEMYLGALKELIGHTKAASGIAGFIKTVLVTRERNIPAQHTHVASHNTFSKENKINLPTKERSIKDQSFTTGVSSFGFGGINVHVSLANNPDYQEPEIPKIKQGFQDAELFLFAASDHAALVTQVMEVLDYAEDLSVAELGDLSFYLFNKKLNGQERLAIVAGSGVELSNLLNDWLSNNEQKKTHQENIYYSNTTTSLKIGFLFPGQGTGKKVSTDLYANHFPRLQHILETFNAQMEAGDMSDTAFVQPLIVRNSALALDILNELNINAAVGIGHSLGELSALYWAGAFSLETLKQLTTERGKLMKQYGDENGRLYSVEADAQRVQQLINGHKIVIACQNSEVQTVIAGHERELKKFENILGHSKLPFTPIAVTRAFHSPLMEKGIPHFKKFIDQLSIDAPLKKVYSPTTSSIPEKEDLPDLLTSQFNSPVMFKDLFKQVDQEVDVWVEVGSGRTLSRLIKNMTKQPIFALELSESYKGLLQFSAFLFANDYPITLLPFFENRYFRSFTHPFKADFFQNPCENFSAIYELPYGEPEDETKHANDVSLFADSALEALLKTVSEKINLPIKDIEPDSKMLDDLHLNSIVVTNIIAEAGQKYGYAIPGNPTEYANASLIEISTALKKMDRAPEVLPLTTNNNWVDLLKMEWVKDGTKKIGPEISMVDYKEPEKNKIFNLPKNGIGIWLVACTVSDVMKLLLEIIERIKKQVPERLLIIQDESWLTAWCKSFFLEHPEVSVLLLHAPDPYSVDAYMLEEWDEKNKFKELKLGKKHRQVQQLRRFGGKLEYKQMVYPSDVVLVSGGAKGITAECALGLAKAVGNTTILLGRTPAEDPQIQSQLNRFAQADLKCAYYVCDVSKAMAVKHTIKKIREKFEKIDLLLHGAASNEPTLIENTSKDQIEKTLAPKYFGLKNLMEYIGPELKQIIGFGSIIGQSGMAGNSDYALANEWMSNLLKKWSAQKGHRAVTINWSVWSGTGMGDRLGVLEQLHRQGIDPIPIEKGVEWFLKITNSKLKDEITVAGKYGNLPTLKSWRPKLNSARFLEDFKMFYPGRELIVEAKLHPKTDLYLDDHLINGVRVLPTVVSLEAMSQVAACLVEKKISTLQFHNVQLLQPVVIPNGGLKIQIRAYREKEEIQLSILASHDLNSPLVKAKFLIVEDVIPIPTSIQKEQPPALDVEKELYGELLFHTGRFQCLERYYHLTAKKAAATVRPAKKPWYKGMPNKMLSLDPAINDAMLHMVQACVPHYTLLPAAIDKVYINAAISDFAKKEWHIVARENFRNGDVFNYNISLLSSSGVLAVHFAGVDFHIVKQGRKRLNKLATSLQKVALQRVLQESGMGGVQLFINDPLPPHTHRPDGKPLLTDDKYISKSHQPNFDLGLIYNQPIACDVELVEDRSTSIWKKMLSDFQDSSFTNWSANDSESYTRQWGIKECLRKLGILKADAIKLKSSIESDLMEFISPHLQILSWLSFNRDHEKPMVITIVRQRSERIPSFEYRHTVSFEETNLVGNVYFSNYVKWQGYCREAFLHQKAMQLTDENGEKEPITKLLTDGRLALVTCNTSCNYLREFRAFDEVKIKLTLAGINENRIKMKFDYFRVLPEGEQLMAQGTQEVACMERKPDGGVRAYKNKIPNELRMALEPYMN